MKRRRTRNREAAETRDGTKPKRGSTSNAARRTSSSVAELQKQVSALTRELTEAREQQTATSDALQVIAGSLGDLKPVFETMLAKAVHICGANFGVLALREGDAFRVGAMHNAPAAFAELRSREPTFRAGPLNPVARVAATKRLLHIANLAEDAAYRERDPAAVVFVELAGTRTLLVVPMLKAAELIGVIAIYRLEVRPFADKQIALVTNFAAQGVIAIENARLLTELRESLERQTATAEILGVISRSKFELQPILQSVVDTAERLCRAEQTVIFRLEDGVYRFAAGHSSSPAYLEIERNTVISPGPGTVVGRAAMSRQVVRIDDAWNDPLYEKKRDAKVGGVRSMIGVPLMRNGEPIGVIALARGRVEPFDDRESGLVTTFADQAVIAIENVRLFEAEQERSRELAESLEQQKATSEVLQVIASSTGDLQPVFDAILNNAARICRADQATLFLQEQSTLRRAARYGGAPDANVPVQPSARSGLGRLLATKQIVHIPDYWADAAYLDRDPFVVAAVEQRGIRTSLNVPMLLENKLIGAIHVSRRKADPFTDKQIALVQNFAAQAVIAIENVRLLNELRESLEQQTATADVLRVISGSPGELPPVFKAMLENAARICGANFGNIYRWDGDALHLVASHNLPPAYAKIRGAAPFRPPPQSPTARMIETKSVTQVADLAAERAYAERDPAFVEGVEVGGIRTLLSVPMLKEDTLVGAFTLYRQEVRPFADKQVALVSNFAAQAVIAIENARLLSELRERTDELGRSVDELRALGEVSQAVNSTLDLETVLDTIVAKAVQLSNTDAGAIYVYGEHDRQFHLRATYGMDQDLIDALTHRRIDMSDPNAAAVMVQGEPLQVADLSEEAPTDLNEITLRAGYHARLVAPLIRGEEVVGMLVVRRKTPGAFAQRTIDLMKTFAAQSAVAIENARLFHDIETSLEDLRTAQDRLVQTQKLASLGQLTAGIAHEIKNPLNFVNNFSGVSVELLDELREALGGVKADDRTHAEITELADTLRDNLNKIVQHGRRADSIVKNMLLHSRAGSGEHRPVDINAIVEEAVNLAYHGARAEKQGFNITLERSLDPSAGQVDCFPQEITRVLLNLISNGFYAATKRKGLAQNDSFEPALTVTTRSLGDRVEIRIRDNGTGIPPEVRDKMFNPFFTTKPAGEGTGLGLSISHDIVVKQHAGIIEIDTRPGEFTEFRIVLQRAAAFPPDNGGRP